MSNPVRAFQRDGFDVKVFHEDDPEYDGADIYGRFTDTPNLYPAWDRCKRRVLWDRADYEHHKAENDRWDERTYRYVHAFNDTDGVPRAEAEKYIRQNVARLESLGESWSYLGVVVKVYRAGVKLAESAVWGMESDGDEAYFKEAEDDQTEEALAEARATLDKLCKTLATS